MLPLVARKIADIKRMSAHEVALQTTANATGLFCRDAR
jgi:Tat protein secretion system quality control protein TatD with DNase activity